MRFGRSWVEATPDMVLGGSWHDNNTRRLIRALVYLGMALSLIGPPDVTASVAPASGRLVSVIVRTLSDAREAPETTVQKLGGHLGRRIGIIDGFVARVPANALSTLRSSPGIHSVTLDEEVELLGADGSFDAEGDPGSMLRTTEVIKARAMWDSGFTGSGIDVAVIDSGVAPVDGLAGPGKLINGPDLSTESAAPNLQYLDSYGHGTHIAGIIAGRDAKSGTPKDDFCGVAPDARIVNVKVAGASGATDVSQVIAAIDWLVQHRNDNGMNIRVLNLSFGTDGVQDYRLDPLAYAAEVAWRKGIVVVVAAGNRGYGNKELNNPAYDPYLIAVGAADTRGTPTTVDDKIPGWSSRGDDRRNPDFVAPGKSIASLRVPDSNIDQSYPEARVDQRYFRGTGTSQAAAVVSGAAALLLQQRPDLNPDQVKALLSSTAVPLPQTTEKGQGAGIINLNRARRAPTPSTVQTWPAATGTGSIRLARGSARIVNPEGEELSGENDVFGRSWHAERWSRDSLTEITWSEGIWDGDYWSGGSWNGDPWSSETCASTCWARESWSENSWLGRSWSGKTWSASSWSGNSWSGKTWSGKTWSGDAWSGKTWT